MVVHLFWEQSLSEVAMQNLPAASQRVTSAIRFYRPGLDVLRFFAFLSVFTLHSLILSPSTITGQRILAPIGAFGLCLFFFLSSYLISELLLRERVATGSIHVRAFYVRRMLRIWPLYFGFLLFGKVLGILFPFFALDNYRLLAFVLLAGNWYLAAYGATWSPIEPLWSISVEEQFYVLWPLVGRFGGTRTLGILSVAFVVGGWIHLQIYSPIRGSSAGLAFDDGIWRNSFFQFQFFGLGALTAIALRGRSLHWGLARRLSVGVSGLVLWLAASGLFHWSHFADRIPGPMLALGYALVGGGCILMLLSMLAENARPPEWLVRLGRISYGLYVFHWLFLVLIFVVPYRKGGDYMPPPPSLTWFAVKYVAALAATMLVAVLSYRFLEAPFLQLKKKFTFVASRPV
jgi:peptidoglycan/LPS O-acetylase OafA/YrhL